MHAVVDSYSQHDARDQGGHRVEVQAECAEEDEHGQDGQHDGKQPQYAVLRRAEHERQQPQHDEKR